MGGKNQTQTTQSGQTYTPAGLSGLQDIWSRLQQVASQPYTAYTGQMTAGITPTQQGAITNLSSTPYLSQAGNFASSAGAPINPSAINSYMNPYQQSVIDATQRNFNEANAQQQQQVLGNAAAQGALGGDRVGVTQAQLARQQQLAQAPVLAGLNAQNYQQALQAAQADRAAQLGAASTLGGLQGVGTQAGLAQLGAGSVEQQTNQAGLNAAYQQFMQQQAFPYQQAQFLASLGLPTLTSMGGTQTGTSTTTAPGPNPITQALGLGIAGLGALGQAGGSAGIAGLAPLFAMKDGGRVPATVPETNETLLAQQDQLVDGDRAVQMFPLGSHELALPDGFSKVETENGTFHFNPFRIDGGTIRALSKSGRENELLGLGPFSKDDLIRAGGDPVSIIERTPAGVEVRAAGGTTNTLPFQFDYLMRNKSDGNSVSVENPFDVLRYRTDSQQYADGGSVGGAAFPYALTGISSYIPTVGKIPIAAAPQMPAMQIPNMLNRDGDSGLPSASAIKDAINNIKGNSAGTNTGTIGGTAGNLPPLYASGGRVGGDFVGTIHSLRNAMRSGRKYADGGLIPNYIEGSEAPSLIPNFNPSSPIAPTLTTPFSMPNNSGWGIAPQLPEPSNVKQYAIAPVGGAVGGGNANPYATAIGGMESSNRYDAVGPETGKGRALGRYQVMDFNVGPWTKEILGREMTPDEFIKNPEAQDAVFQGKFVNQYVPKYGEEGAARAWIGGPGGVSSPARKDILGTSVGDYGKKFIAAIGSPTDGPPQSSVSQSPFSITPSDDDANIPVAARPTQAVNNASTNLLNPFGLSSEANQALMAAGLGMMASRSPFALSAIGEGGLQGVQAYAQAKKSAQDQATQQQRVDLEAKRLAQQIDQFSKQHGLAREQFEDQKTQRTVQQMQPVKIGQGKWGEEIYAVRDPKTGTYRVINPQTGDFADQPAPQSSVAPPPTSAPVRAEADGIPSRPGEPQPVKLASTVLPDINIPVSDKGVPKTTAEALLPTETAPQSVKGLNIRILEENPEMAETIKGISEGRIQLPARAFNTPYGKKLLDTVTRYDPSFDQTNVNTRRGLRTSYLGGGKASENIASFNMTMQHVEELEQAINDLNNFKTLPMLNKPLGMAQRQYDTKYQAALKRFELARDAVTKELTRAFRGTGGNVYDIAGLDKIFDPFASPVELHSGVKTAIKLLGGRIEAQGDRWNTSMGPASQRDPLSWLSPKARDAYDRITAMDPEEAGGVKKEAPKQSGFTGRTATGPNGQKLRETSDGKWVP